MEPSAVFTSNAPKPIGPYSQAMAAGQFLFISGQIPLVPASNALVGPTIGEQTRQAIKNLKAVLSSQSLELSSLVKTTVFLRSMVDFAAFNTVYEQELAGAKPARSVVEVSGLPKNVLIEIEAIACR
jgi:2-iminobutanoate/2-iminopropanoate deaminase